MKSCFLNQRGYVLITTYIMMTVLAISVAATAMRTHIFTREASRLKNALLALQMAEAGVDHALTELALSSSYLGTGGYQNFTSGNSPGGYSVTVNTPLGQSATVRQISATGHAPSNVSTEEGYRSVNINVYTQFQNGPFSQAIFGDLTVSLALNASIDSYNSNNGAYDSNSPSSNGDVLTNSVTVGGVTMAANTDIKGDVEVGSGGDPNTVVVMGSGATISGAKSTQTTNANLPVLTTSVPSAGALNVGVGTTTLPAGTYHYDSITITGNGQLNTSGEAIIYVGGPISTSGSSGISGYQNLPKNLQIYVTTNDAVFISGGGGAYCTLYAPSSSVAVQSSDVYGAVIGSSVTFGENAGIHYDESLSSVGSTSLSGKPTLLAWIQTSNTQWTD